MNPNQDEIDDNKDNEASGPNFIRVESLFSKDIDEDETTITGKPNPTDLAGVDVHKVLANVTKDVLVNEFLEQLPSKQIDRVVEVAAQSLKKRRSSVIHTRSLKKKNTDIDMEVFKGIHEESGHDDVDNTLRSIPTTLSRKRHIKSQVPQKQAPKIGRCRSLQLRLAMMMQHFSDHMKSALGLFDLWKSHLVTIEGYFGTSVVSYFKFLQWVLIINVPLFLVTFGFMVIPQIMYRFNQREPRGYDDAKSFTGKELITGSGFFEQTEMYYGFYTNETVEVVHGTKYEMKYAYLLTCGGYYLTCFIILGYVYLRSYRKYYIESSGTNESYWNIVFCGWDYGITNLETSELKLTSIYNEIKEFLSGSKRKRKQRSRKITRKDKLLKWLHRVAIWMFVFGLLAGSGYATFISSVELSLSTAKANETSIAFVSPLATPVIISSLHLVVPMIFTFLEGFETYSEPKYELYIHMFRDMALKGTMLGVLIYFWFDVAAIEIECWETFVGQEIYRLVIVDLIFTLLYSFLMEFIRKLLSLKWQQIKRSEFAIGRHTLELIYSQSLCWFGVFFSPLLPLIMILKLIFIFYVKRYSVVDNCVCSLKPWRASNTHTIFMGYLFFFFILCFGAAGSCIFLIEPSKSCGPYKTYETTYEVIELLIDQWKGESSDSEHFFEFIVSPGLIALYLIVLSVSLFFMRTVMKSHMAVVEQLKLQVTSENKDKRFLINLLNQMKQRGRRISRHPGPILALTIENMSSANTRGKVFVRSAVETIATGYR